MSSSIMTFLKERLGRWEHTEELLRSGLGRLSEHQVLELGQLYRLATSDLAMSQRDFPADDVTVYVNRLVARTHALLYGGETWDLGRLRRFFAQGFPQLVYQHRYFFLLSAACFLVPALVAYFITTAGGEVTLVSNATAFARSSLQRGELWTQIPQERRSRAASFIMTNNIRVTFLAFAGGVLLGLGTLYILVFNGLMFGTIAGLVQSYGLSAPFWAFVLPHGVLELTVIIIAGAAGLSVGYTILRPGPYRRADALSQQARQAVRLIAGGAVFLIVAGTIEGFISPAALPMPVRWGIGALSGLLLVLYLRRGFIEKGNNGERC